MCHFLWYGGFGGDGLRSVGEEALPSSKSVCSILPIVRHLRAGVSRTSHPAVCFAPLKRCAGPQVVRAWLFPVGRAHATYRMPATSSVLGSLASIMGRSFLSLLASDPAHCPAPMP